MPKITSSTTRFAQAAALAVLLATAAHAQLLLTGRVTGSFTDTAGPNDTVYNASDGSYSYFASGIPEHSSDKQTEIQFWQKSFTDQGPGLVADNIFTVTNGRTLLHSTATAAHFSLWVDITSPESHSGQLTAIPFTIENTPNGADPNSVNDNYTISASPISPFVIDGYRVQFTFDAPPSFTIAENSSAQVGSLSVTFTPVPEPATYGAIGAAVLLGLIGFRMINRRKATPIAAAAA